MEFDRDEYEIEEEVQTGIDQGTVSKPSGKAKPKKKLVAGASGYDRDLQVKLFVLQVANGVCELCDENAPFVTGGGRPYLEVHHVKWLAKGGSDTVENAVAVCPNCHSRFHHSADKEKALDEIYGKVARLIKE